MKTAYVMLAIFALAVMAAVPVMADNYNSNVNNNQPLCNTGGDCQGAAWSTSPLPNCQCPTLENITETPEWQKCGTFCEAGQVPPGWPYGWNDEYWLRPDSNF